MSKIYQTTNVGRVRKNNEDALLVMEPNIFVAADGMGGQAAGEVASQMLIDTARDFLPRVPEPLDENILTKVILKANAAILKRAREDSSCHGMGTTATILHFYKGQAYFAHVGDSRLYRLRRGDFRQMTEDHSYVEMLVKNGELTPDEARVHPLKNILTQAVGAVEDVTVDTGNFPLEVGDIFLLCTDGLTNMVEDAEIAKILAENKENPADALVQAALDGGGHDNVSVIVVEFGE